MLQKIEYAAKTLAHAERPGDRRTVDLQHRFDLLDQREPVAHLAVHLVDERDDRRRTQTTHVEELDRLRFDAFCRVDDHYRRVDRGEHAIRILRVDRMSRILELHHRAGYRDSALLLDFHPIRCRMARALPRLDRAGKLNGAAEQQQLFGQRRLAGIRVRNDRERAPVGDVAHKIGWKGSVTHRSELQSKPCKKFKNKRRSRRIAANADYTNAIRGTLFAADAI